jgi:hypothetical protein
MGRAAAELNRRVPRATPDQEHRAERICAALKEACEIARRATRRAALAEERACTEAVLQRIAALEALAEMEAPRRV